MNPKKVSGAMLQRLPVYLEYLKSLPADPNAYISATALAKALGLGDVMVRKDLAVVSSGGRKKIGHLRDMLIEELELYLKRNNGINAVIVGVGRLGDSLLSYEGFDSFGVNILAGFDVDPSKIRLDTVKPVYLMSELNDFCLSHKIRIGIIAVPAERAQKAANQLADAGVDAIWNFAPAKLTVPDSILLRNENLNVSLAVLRTRLDPK